MKKLLNTIITHKVITILITCCIVIGAATPITIQAINKHQLAIAQAEDERTETNTETEQKDYNNNREEEYINNNQNKPDNSDKSSASTSSKKPSSTTSVSQETNEEFKQNAAFCEYCGRENYECYRVVADVECPGCCAHLKANTCHYCQQEKGIGMKQKKMYRKRLNLNNN